MQPRHQQYKHELQKLFAAYKVMSTDNIRQLKTKEVALCAGGKKDIFNEQGLSVQEKANKKQALLKELNFLIAEKEVARKAINRLDLFLEKVAAVQIPEDEDNQNSNQQKELAELEREHQRLYENATSQYNLLIGEYLTQIDGCIGATLSYAEDIAEETPSPENTKFLVRCINLVNLSLPRVLQQPVPEENNTNHKRRHSFGF